MQERQELSRFLSYSGIEMPFAKTAYFGDREENVLHFNAVRVHVTGNGQLRSKLWALDEEDFDELYDIAIPKKSDVQPTELANLVTQRASIEVRLTAKNDWFRINRIILFAKFFASEHPR